MVAASQPLRAAVRSIELRPEVTRPLDQMVVEAGLEQGAQQGVLGRQCKCEVLITIAILPAPAGRRGNCCKLGCAAKPQIMHVRLQRGMVG